MKVREKIRAVMPIGMCCNYEELSALTGLHRETLRNNVGHLLKAGEFESLGRGVFRRCKDPADKSCTYDLVLSALSATEPRGTAELCQRTGLPRKVITSAIFRLKNKGLVTRIGMLRGNGTARFVLTGREETPTVASKNDVEFIIPDNLPDWLTMPVYRPTGEVRRVMWE